MDWSQDCWVRIENLDAARLAADRAGAVLVPRLLSPWAKKGCTGVGGVKIVHLALTFSWDVYFSPSPFFFRFFRQSWFASLSR